MTMKRISAIRTAVTTKIFTMISTIQTIISADDPEITAASFKDAADL